MWAWLSRSTGSYLSFYQELAHSWWANLTFWDYIGVMAACLAIGYVWLQRTTPGRA